MIKGNLHLTDCKALDAKHAENILLRNGISISYYNCKELPTENTYMKWDEFIKEYKNQQVQVEGQVWFDGCGINKED